MAEDWLKIQNLLKERFGKVPDMEGILFLIGLNELGSPTAEFTKEQKQDLMHIAVCKLLSLKGYFEFEGYDEDGWPHYVKTDSVPYQNMPDQEALLKECIIMYFN